MITAASESDVESTESSKEHSNETWSRSQILASETHRKNFDKMEDKRQDGGNGEKWGRLSS